MPRGPHREYPDDRFASWTEAQLAALVGVLVLVILVLVMMWPRQAAAPDHVTVRVLDGPTVLSTQVVPLR